MKNFLRICALGLLLTVGLQVQTQAQTSKYKCMVQMIAYTGEEAYIVVSLMNPKGDYEKTVYMMGDEKKWYNGFKEWFKFFNKNKKIDGKTSASVGGGDRALITIDIDDAVVNKGYKLRFESSVEAQKYHMADVEIPLTTEALAGKADGKGYIKYIRFSKVQP